MIWYADHPFMSSIVTLQISTFVDLMFGCSLRRFLKKQKMRFGLSTQSVVFSRASNMEFQTQGAI